MKILLPPDAWRSEAFAEDLYADPARRAPSPGIRREGWRSTAIGLLPVVLAVLGVLVTVINHA